MSSGSGLGDAGKPLGGLAGGACLLIAAACHALSELPADTQHVTLEAEGRKR